VQRGMGASKAREAPPWNKRIMWTRFDVFEYLISPALKPSHHSRLTTVQTLVTIEVELMKDCVTPSCITNFLIVEEKERARRVAEREEERTVVVVVASGKGQQPRCGRSFYLLLQGQSIAAHAVLCKLRQGPDQTCWSDGCRARNAPKLAKRQRLLPDAMTTMVRAAVLAAVLGQLLGPSVASRPAGAHPGHAYFEQPCCGRSHLRHHKGQIYLNNDLLMNDQ
ncbi:hypothetical protein ALC57_04757, partial [Trachymyrmex cornetzi]